MGKEGKGRASSLCLLPRDRKASKEKQQRNFILYGKKQWKIMLVCYQININRHNEVMIIKSLTMHPLCWMALNMLLSRS